MSHCHNSSRRIKYFYIVAFLSVWKNFRSLAVAAARAAQLAFLLQGGSCGPEKARFPGSSPLCITVDMYDKFVFT
jgi:hypothetical protein